MPSLCWESQGLVAVEAMINGIPVIASERSALPETLGDAGIILLSPAPAHPVHARAADGQEMEPWVKAVIGLWDDPAWYAEACRRSRVEAGRWDPAVLEPLYADFFGAVGIRETIPPPQGPAYAPSGPIRKSRGPTLNFRVSDVQ